jgi:hypothetical protein
MRLCSLSAPLVLTLLTASLAIGCGDTDKADDDGGADGADGAVDGATDGTSDGSGDGASDGSADGASDGGGDGSADGASDGGGDGSDDGGDGAADGTADGGDGGGTADDVVFSDGFEDVRVEEVYGSWATGSGAGVTNWLLTPFSYSGYDPSIGDFEFYVNGGLYTDSPGELTSADPLPAPAGGQQCVYMNGYASRDDGSIGGYFDLKPEAVTIEAERRYVLDLALGRRIGYPNGVAQVFFYADGGGPDQVLDQADVQIIDLPEGGFANYRLEIDPTDSLAGTPLNVRVQLYQAYTSGHTTFLLDNVTITAVPAAAN